MYKENQFLTSSNNYIKKMFDEKLNKLPEMNLKALTTLNCYPNTVNIGSVNFHTNFNMNLYTNNKNNINNLFKF